jgi:DNA repair exonuclease SbcCD nuclease subunit
MSTVRKSTDKPIAIFCSDIHLSLTPPVYRMNEPDWFAAMRQPIDELSFLSNKWKVPIFCAGDIFDRWNSSPELINWALDNLPTLYCIPGQHDLPEHAIKQIERSAYWTLVKAGKILHMSHRVDISKRICVWPFPYGSTITTGVTNSKINIAMIHEYNWIKGHSYGDHPFAAPCPSVKEYSLKFKGYDLVFSGDNHIPFTTTLKGKRPFVNCGTLMRRHSNDNDIDPSVWILFENIKTNEYSVLRHCLNTDDEIYADTSEKDTPVENSQILQLVENLKRLKKNTVDFETTLNLYIKTTDVPTRVKQEIIKALEE